LLPSKHIPRKPPRKELFSAQLLLPTPEMIRVDLHLHSTASHDGWATPLEIVGRALSAGLDKIAITDHGEVHGALEAQSRFPSRVIVGEEIHCRGNTHLIGLFLKARIPHGLPIAAAAKLIREQGGVVYAPHPFAYLTRTALRSGEVLAVADVVEVFNSRAFIRMWNRRALRAASERNLAMAASSDAHFPHELGRAYTELPDFDDARSFLQSATRARPVGNRIGSPWLHVGSKVVADWRWVTGRR
jgi:predicted metal-dependent phosphoesterase TrpH